MKQVKCSLCTQSFIIDSDLVDRMKRHEQFHREYGVKNLVHGNGQWSVRE